MARHAEPDTDPRSRLRPVLAAGDYCPRCGWSGTAPHGSKRICGCCGCQWQDDAPEVFAAAFARSAARRRVDEAAAD